jgi:hypothetical protein
MEFLQSDTSSLTPNLISAVVCGLEISTGYGSIAPLGGETNPKTIGRAQFQCY